PCGSVMEFVKLIVLGPLWTPGTGMLTCGSPSRNGPFVNGSPFDARNSIDTLAGACPSTPKKFLGRFVIWEFVLTTSNFVVNDFPEGVSMGCVSQVNPGATVLPPTFRSGPLLMPNWDEVIDGRVLKVAVNL